MTRFDVLVIGAGAAGLMCAIRAGQRGRRVLLIDHAEEAGKKILISGGGRCNFTNRDVRPERFLSANPHFARSALSRYTPRDFLALIEKHGIAWHEKTLGQLFCDGSAKQVVAMLLAEARAVGVELRLNQRVSEITRHADFRVATDREVIAADSLVLATGGISIPKMGATGFAYDVAARFGLKLVERRPALVPLAFGGEQLELMQPLAGVSLPVIAKAAKAKFPEAMLFTHRGLSGPAILQVSSYWREGETVTLDLLPGQDAVSLLLAAKRARPKAEPRTVLGEFLPARLAQALAERHLPGIRMADLQDRAVIALANLIKAWKLTPSTTEGYAKAEVTLGGVDTDCLSQQNLMAKEVPGLFVIGEAVDVTGWLGGYNFQWAWASGWAAGEAA